MRGDLLFYTPTDWIGKLVAWATNGPFCHVALDMDDSTKIEADWNGIVRVQNITRIVDARFETSKVVPKVDDGMAWLQVQVGNPYGKADIVSQVLRFMGFHFYTSESKHYDCSDLAARFLMRARAGSLLGP
jgi:hypothetical protein